MNNDLISFEVAYNTILCNFYTKPYLYELVSKKAIPSQKIGKKIVFSKIALQEWIDAGRYDYNKAGIVKEVEMQQNQEQLYTVFINERYDEKTLTFVSDQKFTITEKEKQIIEKFAHTRKNANLDTIYILNDATMTIYEGSIP